MTDRPMQEIPISAAREIAEKYGYDQVVLYARRVGENPDPHGEHITTYGRTPEHCSIAARMSARLQELMGWSPQTQEIASDG